jgi:hypothetical protein
LLAKARKNGIRGGSSSNGGGAVAHKRGGDSK